MTPTTKTTPASRWPARKAADVQKAANGYRDLSSQADERRAQLHLSMIEAHRSGVHWSKLAEATGLSRRRVHQIIAGEPPDQETLDRLVAVVAQQARGSAALDAQADKALDLLRQRAREAAGAGMTVATIADLTGYGRTWVYSLVESK